VKLLDLHLQAYGPFTDRHLDLSAGSEGLHLVFGPNEAGKSSALRALRALFYEIPTRTADDFRHDKKKLKVGGLLRSRDGAELHCYRRKGRKNTLLDVTGKPLAEQALTRFLGGVAEPLFERLFGIDHEALVSGGQALLVEHGREAEALFGTGLGSTAVHGLLEGLDQEAKTLFAPRASKPAINAGLGRFAELDRQQRQAVLSAHQWEAAREALDAATRSLQQIDTRLAAEERRRNTLERIRRSLPALARREQLREQFIDLGAVPALADDFGERREQALSKHRLATEGRAKAAARLQGLNQDAEGLELSEQLLAEAEAIDELRDRLGGYHKAARDRPGLLERRLTLVEQARRRFAEIRPDLSIEGIEALRPLLSRRRQAAGLGGRREALKSAVKTARASREETAGKLEKKRHELSRLPPPVRYEGLQRAVAEAQRAGDADGAVDTADAELTRHQEACRRELGALGIWTGTLEDLMGAPLPGEETLQRFTTEFQTLEEEQRRLQASISEVREEQRRTQESLQALRLAGETPTEKELLEARDHRDQGWRLLKRQWIAGEEVSAESRAYTEGEPLHDVFEAGIADTDEIADRLRRESQRVHEQAAAEAKLEGCRKLITQTETELERVSERLAGLEQEWRQAWKASGIAPASPREMAAWVVKATLLRDQAKRSDELRDKTDTLRRHRESRLGNLRSALAACGQTPPDTSKHGELRPLLDHAEACLDALERNANRRAVLEEAIAELEDAQRRLSGEAAHAEEALDHWSSDWTRLMGELGYRERATPGEVSDYLQAISDGLKLVDDAKALQLRIDGIDTEARELERDVKRLMTRLAPDLAERPIGEAILQLAACLTAQRETKSRLDELHKQVRKTEGEIREADAIILAATEVLDELCRQANCDSPNELEAIERRFLEHRELTKQLREVEAELVQGGDGLSVQALAAEAKDIDQDAVVTELAALNQRIDQELRPERESLFEQKLGAEQEFHAMAGNDAASALADQAQQTLSEVRGHAEKYLRLRLAARLLRDEIEAFRRRHRDPILTRAGGYFRHLTCGSLATIDSDFDESDQPVLVGVRPNGERLRVEAMSNGTRDQLYLALRLATLDHYVEGSEPLPFIVDDILIQFDDQRSRATLETLADFSAKTQVILFTHHERVVEQAKGVDGAAERVFVHELG